LAAEHPLCLRHSAAIYGLRGKKDVSIFILYPYGRVSPIQEAQMATVPDENVHCVAVDGTFDDCQVCAYALTQEASLADLLPPSQSGHCQDPVLRCRVQRDSPTRRGQQHQLGANPRSDRLLLPRLPPPSRGDPLVRQPRRGSPPRCTIHRPDWKLW
jgi:hypothetical protein